ncbi:helix-turn-helix domain-containing protein [Gryllotalpicola kribbensis]|uniref:Helix-turn-helix domain-containing protein n=1 Tax=Gryllotalpicola kribbensis TaxID=993084 RepID=A0ABP8AEK4_9MICO
MQNLAGPGVLSDCPTRLTVEILSEKWAALVIFALRQGPRRHGELVDVVGGISRKMLAHTLRRLADYGLVERRAGASRRIEYRLTELGETLIGPIEVLNDWARDNGGAVTAFQERAEGEGPLA